MDGIAPRVQINLIVDNANKKEVYNLSNSNKVILSPSYLERKSNDFPEAIDQPSLEEKVSTPSTATKKDILDTCKYKNFHRTMVVSMGNANPERNNTFYPVRNHSNSWKGGNDKEPFRVGQSIKLNVNSKIISVIPEREPLDNGHPKLNEFTIQSVIKEVLTAQLAELSYDHNKCKHLSAVISEMIHDRLKLIGGGSYKIAVNIFIGEIRGHGIETATQCIWDPKSDSVVTGFYKNNTLIAVATVFASYSEQNTK